MLASEFNQHSLPALLREGYVEKVDGLRVALTKSTRRVVGNIMKEKGER